MCVVFGKRCGSGSCENGATGQSERERDEKEKKTILIQLIIHFNSVLGVYNIFIAQCSP